MSVRIKKNRRSGLYFSSDGFSSKSMGSDPVRRSSTTSNVVPIKPVTVNKSLLAPLKTDIDPEIQVLRTQEKEQIKGLNNRFASHIKKVQLLEQQNKMLETKWQLMQSQVASSSSTEFMYKAYIANLQKQLEAINNDGKRLEAEKNSWSGQLDKYKSKYEKETSQKIETEIHFVELKKDVDASFNSKVELETRLYDLTDKFNFLRAVYDAEMRELQDSVKDTCVVVEMDNSRSLDMDHIVSDVKAHYEEIAAQSREETERWYKTKFDLMLTQTNQYGADLHSTKVEIAEMNRMINRLQQEINLIKHQCDSIRNSITEMESRGEQAVLNAKDRIKDLEKSLMDAKHAMAKQVREYQELMNIKLALDIEISTYKKLLEGEEDRFGQQTLVNIHSAPIRPVSSEPTKSESTHQRQRSGPILIKMVETHATSYN
ncbi:keratin, type II cytoskeletal 8-like isoform X2 [Poeciliopsis prolifica]|uniref:keratin, type II cytoskeletal 8-like isoform X2 n=1 Tax=Poeciliopsis prolifica TaxID=188132 RepID=UPI002413313E|nr:keratin, type II cytoskeletal 8-like isoform X2 [Poeciliopsis prolifica]